MIKNLSSVWMNFRAVAVKAAVNSATLPNLAQETMLDTCRHLVVNCDVLPVKEKKKTNLFFSSIVIIFSEASCFCLRVSIQSHSNRMERFWLGAFRDAAVRSLSRGISAFPAAQPS